MSVEGEGKANHYEEISLALVTELVAEQFPQWAHLPISPIAVSGWDNRTFRLGEEMLLRLPSAASYVPQVLKEQQWLPKLAPHLSLAVPTPLAMGKPSKNYRWNWSVYRWIVGESANIVTINAQQQQHIAVQAAQFLNELHKIDTTSAPLAGAHNYYRGAHPAVYDNEACSAIVALTDRIDADAATAVWRKALQSKWQKNLVWVHGDFSSENILLKDGQVIAVIDFGCMGVGDPACDLVIAWTFLKNSSREVFRENLSLDSSTWQRARGWALWKALITLEKLKDKYSEKAIAQQKIINEILTEDSAV
ncbi:MAG: aminoglycoside phosphotransferase family protein [Gammaproteobacteria bacterium]|nr:aminoglycoside phosphotransferase family protein [Gammaproteobacteria bacterium]